MEQLTGLDATFLYLETPSLHMHVSMAAIFDPSTVPGGYSFDKVRDLVSSPSGAGPDLPAAAGRGALPPGPPLLGRRPDLRHRVPHPPRRGARAGRRGGAGPVRRRRVQPPARPHQAPVGDVHRRRPARGPDRPGDEDPPLHHRRGLGRRAAVAAVRPRARAHRLDPSDGRPCRVDEHLPSDLQLVAQSLGDAPDRPARDDQAGVAHGAGGARRPARPGAGIGTRRTAAHHPPHLAQRRPSRRTGGWRSPRSPSRTPSGIKSALRHHPQRRGAGRVHRRAAPLPHRRRRAPRRPPRGDGPGVGGPDDADRRGANKVSAMFVALPCQIADPVERLRSHPGGHQGGQGGAQRPRRRRAAQLGRARHARTCSRPRPAPTPG